MLIVLSCISTECAKEDMFKVNDSGTKEFKNRSGIPTVSFSQQKLNVNIDAYLHEDNYYVRDNKNHKIYVYILDTDTGKIKGYNLFELTQLVINNVNITNIYRVSQYVYSINFLNLQRQISVSTDPTRIILIQYIMKKQDLTSFFLKSSLIPHCFYIVKLENVNGNSDFVFDFDVVKKDFETLKNSLAYLYNSLYTLAFYKNNGDFVYRVTVDFLTMLILYYKAGKIDEFKRGHITQEIVYEDSSLYDGNKVLFLYASQYLSGSAFFAKRPELDKFELTWYQTPIIYGIPKKIICDNRPFLQLNLRYLSEVQDF